MSNFVLKTPVVLIVFNRPDTTKRVFAEIAKARPSKLFVISDGARLARTGEMERVAQARAVVNEVDWPCDVLTNFSPVNLGCKRRVSSGIDWVFEHVEEAIFLEDDCVPDACFFRFCQEMLDHHRHDLRVGMISGNNFQFGRRFGADSYYFSKYFHIWGWATWRDRWVHTYDVSMSKWPQFKHSGHSTGFLGRGAEVRYWNRVFGRVHAGQVDTWDIQWTFANWLHHRVAVLPQVNLVSNIGFSIDATHTKSYGELADMAVEPIEFPLVHPSDVRVNAEADARAFARSLCLPLWKRVLNRLNVVTRLRMFQ